MRKRLGALTIEQEASGSAAPVGPTSMHAARIGEGHGAEPPLAQVLRRALTARARKHAMLPHLDKVLHLGNRRSDQL